VGHRRVLRSTHVTRPGGNAPRWAAALGEWGMHARSESSIHDLGPDVKYEDTRRATSNEQTGVMRIDTRAGDPNRCSIAHGAIGRIATRAKGTKRNSDHAPYHRPKTSARKSAESVDSPHDDSQSRLVPCPRAHTT